MGRIWEANLPQYKKELASNWNLITAVSIQPPYMAGRNVNGAALLENNLTVP